MSKRVNEWSQADTSEQPCWLVEGVHLLSPQVQVMAMPTNKVQLFPFMFFWWEQPTCTALLYS